jgi:hypothetical protein
MAALSYDFAWDDPHFSDKVIWLVSDEFQEKKKEEDEEKKADHEEKKADHEEKKADHEGKGGGKKRKREEEEKGQEQNEPPKKKIKKKLKWSRKDIQRMKKPLKDFLANNSHHWLHQITSSTPNEIIKIAGNTQHEIKKDNGDGILPLDSVDMDEHVFCRVRICSTIVAGASRVFHKMLLCGLRETHDSRIIIRVANQQEACLFVMMLKYFYCGRLPTEEGLTIETFLYLFILADRYEIVSLMDDCVRNLLKTINTSADANSILEFLDQFHETTLTESCRTLYNKAVQLLGRLYGSLEDFTGSEFTKLSLISLQSLLGTGHGRQYVVAHENTIYQALRHWATVNEPSEELFLVCLDGHRLTHHFFLDVVKGDSLFAHHATWNVWMNTVVDHFLSNEKRRHFFLGEAATIKEYRCNREAFLTCKLPAAGESSACFLLGYFFNVKCREEGSIATKHVTLELDAAKSHLSDLFYVNFLLLLGDENQGNAVHFHGSQKEHAFTCPASTNAFTLRIF